MADFSGCTDCGRELFHSERQHAEAIQAPALCAPCHYFVLRRWADLLNVVGAGPRMARRLRMSFA